ncbi:MAG: tetraacyldisaccharide 4'-kinase [Planctomycetia bacterium]|nr:tetraacyldisaccharide 4'-kinase [Planctomycetia bacterium]
MIEEQVVATAIRDSGLLSPSEFRAIASGERRDVRARLARLFLGAVEIPYTLLVRWRNYGYDRGHVTVHRAGVPVVSVGNLTLGGTGKTPLVAWIARWFGERGLRVVLISRGYGAKEGAPNDEAMELARKLPDVPHLQNADRVAAARTAVEAFQCQVIVLDDAFQHRRMGRDLDIVLIDALAPFGFGRVFPRGMLREPVSGLRRADIVALSRADMVPDDEKRLIHALVERHNPRVVWIEMRHAPCQLLSSSGASEPISSLVGRRMAAFCGIGNPAGFRHTLSECGYDVAGFHEFADHHAFARDDVEWLGRWARELGAAALVCTHKDLVKLGVDQIAGLPLWAVEIELAIELGQAALEAKLEALLAAD